jgi:alkylhydroperoxidase family enzyme
VKALQAHPIDELSLPEADRALLRYAEKLTRAPSTVGPEDVQQLRAAGFDDRAIHDACVIVSYYAFVNRVADGLGVELESSAAE